MICAPAIIRNNWAYYNDSDPYVASWARQLVKNGLVPPGEVDDRSITEVSPDDIKGFTQCHFFCGILGWPLALRLAGWPDDRPCYSGSAPCQPFSQAGRGAGVDDERHLWPVFYKLIDSCRPPVVFGEQVASADVIGKAVKGSRRKAEGTNRPAWLDIICDDLERAHYAVGSTAFPVCSIGAPHIRLRLYWAARNMADAAGLRQRQRQHVGSLPNETTQEPEHVQEQHAARPGCGGAANWLADGGGGGLEGCHEGALGRERPAAERGGCAGGLADMPEPGRDEWPQRDAGADGRPATEPGRLRALGGLADSTSGGWREERPDDRGRAVGNRAQGQPAGLGAGCGDHRPGPTNGFWRDADWLLCRDDKWRPTESSFQWIPDGVSGGVVPVRSFLNPLTQGETNRVGRLRGYGNAISPQQAAEFIRAYLDVTGG